MFSHPNIGFMKASIQTSPKRTKHEAPRTIVDCDMIVREEVIGCEEEKPVTILENGNPCRKRL